MPTESGHPLINVDIVSACLCVFLKSLQGISAAVSFVDAPVIFVLREWCNAYSPDTETGPVDGRWATFEPLSCGLTKDASLII